MPADFLSIPRAVREKIYRYVWSDHCSIRLVYPISKEEAVYEQARDRYRFPEKPARRYPPPPGLPAAVSVGKDEKPQEHDSDLHMTNCQDGAKSSGKPIDFDVQAFLDDFPDLGDEDDEDDDDSDEDEDEDEEGEEASDEFDFGQHGRSLRGYNLQSWDPVDLSLLLVNRRIHTEALAILFSSTAWLLDADAVASIRFITRLPSGAREAISTVTIGGFALLTDDMYCRVAWSGSVSKPRYRDSNTGLTLTTPFAAFLATNLPSLSTVNMYLPSSGSEDWYPSLAPIEMSLLLKYHRIPRLNFVFMGESVARTLNNGKLKSPQCYERLMGRFKDWGPVAEHEFEVMKPPAELGSYSKNSHKRMLRYVEERHAFVRERKGTFEWEWGTRNVAMGSDGNVQALISCFNPGP